MIGKSGPKDSLNPGLCFLASLELAGVAGVEAGPEAEWRSLLLLVLTCSGRKL